MTGQNEKKEFMMIDNLDTLKVLVDPLRLQILQVLNREPQTINQVAERLGSSSSRLYYHFNLMESHGLITVVSTQMVNNIMEKTYWVTAENYEVDKDLLSSSSESVQEDIVQIVSSSLAAVREDFIRSIQAREKQLKKDGSEAPLPITMFQISKVVKDSTFEDFSTRLKDLIQEFGALPEEKEPGDDVRRWSLATYLYPNYDLPKEK